MSLFTSVQFLSLFALISLILAATPASARAQITDDELCELGDDCENEIEDDDDDGFGFSFDDLDDFGEDEEEDGFGSAGGADNLPPCSELTYFEVELGTACSNETVIPEVRLNDVLSERLIRQVWNDIRAKLSEDGEFRGMKIDPLDIGDIHQNQKSPAYSADVKMFDVKIFGLSTIRLDEASVTRDENLTDFDINVRVGFDEITVTGEYDLKGSFGWFEVDSNGTRDFAINIHGASSATLIHLEMVEDGGCAPEGNVVISEMGFPFKYDDIKFRFDNLGPFVNSMASSVAAYSIQMAEERMISEIKLVIRKEISSLLC